MTNRNLKPVPTASAQPPEPANVNRAPMIFGKMVAIMRQVDAIGKDRRCTSGASFAYRGIDDVYNAVQPLLVEHGIFCRAEVLAKHREERASNAGKALIYTTLSMRYHFTAEDGSSVPTEAEGEGMDSGDKSSNKAMSVAHKYAIIQAFCIPTEDIAEPDAEAHQVATKGTPPQAHPGLVSEEQRAEIHGLIKSTGANLDEFCKHFKVGALPDLTIAQYPTCVAMLRERQRRAAAKTAGGGK